MTDTYDGPEIVEVDEKGNVIDITEGPRKRGRVKDDVSEFDDALIEECRDIGIEEWAIRDGGDYRQLEKGKVYWLPLPELLEFEKHDIELIDDNEFFDWFESFIDEQQLQTKAERTKKNTRSWSSWSHEKVSLGARKVSDWWSNWGYDSKSWGTSGGGDGTLTKKLAMALKAVNTTVGVVNDTGKRYRVVLASEGQAETPTSYTSFDERLVVVSAGALLDTNITDETGIDVTTAYGLHEASHIKYSESLRDALTQPSALEPMTVAGMLWNILEDLRIEKLTAEKFPGFADYFGTALEYLWGVVKEKQPPEWGPTLHDKLNSVIGFAKWPEQMQSSGILADPSLAAEYPWWQDWRERYIAGSEDVRIGVIRALERLAEDPQTKQEMDDLTEQEQQAGSGSAGTMSEGQFRDFLEELKEQFEQGGNPLIDACPSPGRSDPVTVELTDEQAEELDALLREQYSQEEATYKMKEGNADGVGPMIEIRRPQEDQWSKDAYNPPGGMVERMRSAFFFRKKHPVDAERLLKSGSIDEDELWRVGLGDVRVFERFTPPEETFTSVTMLIDVSGSMIGRGIDKAQELANAALASLRTQRGVRVRVRAHSTGYMEDRGSTSTIYRIWETGDPDTRIGLLQTVSHGSNFDGFAIDWCAKELVKEAQPDENLLLIVLSDGLPAGSFYDGGQGFHYGGSQAMAHMKGVVNYWERQGVITVQIAIDHEGLRPDEQAQMFNHWIGYENDQKLLTDLTRLLSRTFGGIE